MDNKHTNKHLNKREKQSKTRLSPLRVILYVLISTLIVFLSIYFLLLYRSNKEYERLAEQVHSASISQEYISPSPVPTNTPEATKEIEPTQTPEPSPTLVENPINFSYLRNINSDVIAWVIVDGTDIDYPVAYDVTGTNYYLDHTYKAEYSPSGTVYIQNYNTDDFSDFNTILYGHNMSDGSMFAPLHSFRDDDFFETYDTITIYTPARKLTYQIFAAYRADNKNILLRFDYDTEEQREDYIDHIFNHTIVQYDYDVPVTADDKIITLSTCIGNADYRWLVQGVLISEEETE